MKARSTAIWTLVSAVGLQLVALGCGRPGGESEEGESRVLGQAGETGLGTWEPAELEELCDEAQSYADAQLTRTQLRELGCGQAALQALAGAPEGASDEELRELCAQTHQACMFALEPAPIVSIACELETDDCAAVVSDLESCLTDATRQAAQALIDLPSCEAITAEALAELGPPGPLEEPPECGALRAECPGLLADSVSPGSGGSGGAGGAAGAATTAPVAGAGGAPPGGAGGVGDA
jgi:hypothetical protein